MNKELLIKYIQGKASQQERDRIIAWIDASEQNASYFIALKNLITAQAVTREGKHLILSQTEQQECLRQLERKIKSSCGRNKGPVLKKYIVRAAAILLLFSLGANIFQFLTKPSRKDSAISPFTAQSVPEISTFYTEKGVKGKILLPDSTVVWLNSDSKITYPARFAGDMRKVQFQGEGYFRVKKDSLRPMLITTPKGMNIMVLGTVFHICSYLDADSEEATLFTGRINVSKKIRARGKEIYRSALLKPSESIVFGNETAASAKQQVMVADTARKVAWKRGELIFEQTPMQEVFAMLERWHGMQIIVLDPSVYSYSFTASFGSESMVQIMELIKYTSPVDYRIRENKVYINKRKIQ